ncbi:LOW QUALITY PROTEIN: cytosolic sulfotransferase 5 [Beta vulgaris subsp. vulgaris]|uniref:LOW QUALITY PROTEIN: cytosolic sulfotransferase 5 n=1 Tax=Beta vulgaris subsp. vulgaris TaxID=3555 RepID=UPI0025499CEE|nr:LOW QUALITY PROTEIN: cytosolic sulfotransferase 5 [Beta vulgaris subsp. vulgaris]
MATSEPKNTSSSDQLEDQLYFGFPLQFYQNFWCLSVLFEGVTSFQSQFQALDTDIILASLPKTGTTWLKSLLFALVNRKKFSDISQLPLNTTTPHELVLHFEIEVYKKDATNQNTDLTKVPSPRLFATHMPYPSLPDSIKTSKCRIVYVCRNPWDTFVSLWLFYLQFEISKGIKPDNEMMEEYVSKFCKGICPFGPYNDHVLEYWKKSMQDQEKVLFLEYEGLKKDPKTHLKKLAEFVGCPFSEDEEKGNVVDKIIELCSIKSLKEMEVNKSGKFYPWVENKALFRKGDVGDWTNHLTPSMAKSIDEMQEKLEEWIFFQILSKESIIPSS